MTGGLAGLAKRRNVTVIHAKATFVSSSKLKLERTDEPGKVEELTFDKLVLATGSRPSTVPPLDIGSDRVMDSTVRLELRDIPESLLVVGGGYIGLEMGSVYAELGTKVSVAEFTDGLLPGADRDLVKPLQKRIEKAFDTIMLSTKAVKAKDVGDGVEITLQNADGSNERVVKYSRVLVSVGRRPNSNDIGLENTKVTIDKRGFVVVDDVAQLRIPTSWRSATSPAIRCWRTKRPPKAAPPSRRCTAGRRSSNRWPSRPSSSPIRKSPGLA
ncbi:MAG: FAD-dependent oxidoreductase [Pirellulales bacterium]